MHNYNTNIDPSTAVAIGIIISIIVIIYLIFNVISIIAMWKLFTKANKPGWASIIPIYNAIVLFQIVGLNPLLLLLFLIPFANIIVKIIFCINLAKSFGKSSEFVVGLILLNSIFMLILGLGNSQYVGLSENKA